MEYNEFPSDYYFKLVNTKKDYDKMLASGAAYTVEPHFPSSWDMHCNMKMQWELGKWHGYIVGSAIYKTR